MDAEYIEHLKGMLRKIGYSGKAIKEILKWYQQNNS